MAKLWGNIALNTARFRQLRRTCAKTLDDGQKSRNVSRNMDRSQLSNQAIRIVSCQQQHHIVPQPQTACKELMIPYFAELQSFSTHPPTGRRHWVEAPLAFLGSKVRAFLEDTAGGSIAGTRGSPPCLGYIGKLPPQYISCRSLVPVYAVVCVEIGMGGVQVHSYVRTWWAGYQQYQQSHVQQAV